jgi:hypothetical protein
VEHLTIVRPDLTPSGQRKEILMAIDEQKMGPMYLGAAYFDGDPGELLPAYHRMLDKFGLEGLDVHLCITRDGGLTVFDACPTREIYEEFIRSETFLGAIAEAGLPEPRVSGLGDVQVAHVRQTVRR